MPCVALARGMRQTAPHTGMVFDDRTDTNPCGRKILTTVNGVSVAAENLCPLHWQMVHGQRDYVLPVVLEP
jgi:hypothetical protein